MASLRAHQPPSSHDADGVHVCVCVYVCVCAGKNGEENHWLTWHEERNASCTRSRTSTHSQQEAAAVSEGKKLSCVQFSLLCVPPLSPFHSFIYIPFLSSSACSPAATTSFFSCTPSMGEEINTTRPHTWLSTTHAQPDEHKSTFTTVEKRTELTHLLNLAL